MEKIITNIEDPFIEDPLILASIAIRKINELIELNNKQQKEIDELKKKVEQIMPTIK